MNVKAIVVSFTSSIGITINILECELINRGSDDLKDMSITINILECE